MDVLGQCSEAGKGKHLIRPQATMATNTNSSAVPPNAGDEAGGAIEKKKSHRMGFACLGERKKAREQSLPSLRPLSDCDSHLRSKPPIPCYFSDLGKQSTA